jgi:EAL domain-containing protein (putative c-di-GMP-specific phosphodiesterase class I)
MKTRAAQPPAGAPTTAPAQPSRGVSIQWLIEMGLIDVHLQPVVELRTGAIYGYEALARCRVKEMASPLQLLAAAVEQDEIGRLGRELRVRAARAAGGARLFLNIHPDELDEPFLTAPDDPIASYAGQVVLEIPEAAPLMRHRHAHATVATLRGRGMLVALDDFGAGYSNLGYISALAPEIVKLDRELIAGVSSGSRQQHLLGSLAALCRGQGALVVAEGVETHGELIAVMQAGVPLAQGYFLGRPSPTGASTWRPA